MLRVWRASLLFFLAATASCVCALAQQITLDGSIDARQADSYVAVPFQVPPDTEQLSVTFDYTGREDKTMLDLGLFDPERFRGWSGGNKREFTVGVSSATPSYLPGPLPAGPWKLLIGVAYLKPGQSTNYHAVIRLVSARGDDAAGFSAVPLVTGKRWYRGDLHMHTAHSDGTCASQSGAKVPCPLFRTVEQAAEHKLDFIAITDHNTTSHYDEERELQPYFDRLLLIPGRELTTYSGHMNIFGTTRFVDFRLEAKGTLGINQAIEQAKDAGAIVSVNHPGDPTGPSCIGCGWSITDTDWTQVTSIEAINGNDPAHYNGDIRFWEGLLARGYRLTAIGGSDTHRPDEDTIGHPTTVAYADALSVPAILEAVRKGRVCIDLAASHDRVLDIAATAGASSAVMGDDLRADTGATVNLTAEVVGLPGATLVWLVDGKTLAGLALQRIPSPQAQLAAAWKSDGGRHWVRAEVRDTTGRLLVLGNPIFVNWR